MFRETVLRLELVKNGYKYEARAEFMNLVIINVKFLKWKNDEYILGPSHLHSMERMAVRLNNSSFAKLQYYEHQKYNFFSFVNYKPLPAFKISLI